MKAKKVIGFGILVVLLLSSFSAAGLNSGSPAGTTTALIRIDQSAGNIVLPEDVEIVAQRQNEWVDIIIPSDRLTELTSQQVPYSIVIPDMNAYHSELMGSYHTLAEVESMLQTIASSYPSITSLTTIGTTYEGRSIKCLEISDNPGVDEGEPGVFFMGLHHAREWPTVEISLHVAKNLTSLYGSNSTITNLVNNRRIWIIPVVNPDGYYYCHDLGNDWRKNRKPYPGGIGVDLNRNYAGASNGDPWGSWGSSFDGSTTHDPGEEVYCGPYPFSELETQAIRDIFLHNDISACISWHTYSELVMWPWGYTPSYAPDRTYLMQIGQQIASRITKQSGSGTYTPQQSCTLYPTTGDTCEWAYGYGHYVLGKAIFSYCIEACSTFHPSTTYLDQICKENCEGALYLLQEAQNIRDTVVPRVMPPVIDELPNDPDGNYEVSWEEQNPSADPDYFQLDELSGLSLTTDDAESGSGLWTLNGFALSTSRYHSAGTSFKSRYANDDVSSMTTTYPIPITNGMKLSFWCWYMTEIDYDYAFVEVSRDGCSYDMLDSFVGSSGSWLYKEYDLSEYVGDSLIIRFRYATDGNTLQEGFYVDDITPVADVQTVTTLSNTITEHSFDVTGKTNGTYFYRVKGHNTARGWCDFSTLERVVVLIGNDTTPPVTTCTLTGDLQGGVYVSDVTVTLTATDDSGVDYTNYKLDDGAWVNYTTPFVVSANGNHTVWFYSVDTAGNIETEKNCSFIIQQEIPTLTIEIKGGLGVSAVITNTGMVTLTNLTWTIDLDGALLFFGKTKSRTISTLEAGASTTIRDFVIGLGKTGIAVKVGAAKANATGTVLLFFVIGVQ
ncbi:MAG: immune inhibitor A [Candidatus Thermoplasmatota archaeon]|nr:immune inhibitor A [Candidatus Thermoplasmatota archaeon]